MEHSNAVISSALYYAINKFKVIPVWLWLLQLFVISFFSMYFFVLLSEYIGNPEASVRYVVIGNIVQIMATTTLYAVSEIPGVEKHTGTLPSLMETPSSLFQIFVGMSILNIISGIISCSLSLFYAKFIFAIDLSSINLVSVIVIMLLTVLCLAGMGMFIGSVGLRLRTSVIIANLVTYIGMFICGVNYPITYLPDPVQAIANVFPLTYAVNAMRGAADGADLISLAGYIIPMLALGVIYLLLSVFLFGIFEKRARATGSYEKF